MDKIDPSEFNSVLKDVRASYRLLAIYHRRILDIVKYIGNHYDLNFSRGWAKFSNPVSHSSSITLDKWSWDWLSMYLYEFNMGSKEIAGDTYNFKIVHQADTGFYDSKQIAVRSEPKVDHFGDLNNSETRLFFVISKNEDGCPLANILNDNLSRISNIEITKGNWLLVAYDMDRFFSQEKTDIVLEEFNQVFASNFGVRLID